VTGRADPGPTTSQILKQSTVRENR